MIFKNEAGEIVTPQKGDFIHRSDIDTAEKHAAVRAEFPNADASAGIFGKYPSALYLEVFRKENLVWSCFPDGRRIIPQWDAPTLFEAAKDAPDGTRFLLVGSDQHVVKHDQLRLIWADDGGHVEYGHLQRTDFEIVPSPRKRDVGVARVYPRDEVFLPDDNFDEGIEAFRLIGRLLMWEGAQIGKPGYVITFTGARAVSSWIDFPNKYEVTFKTAEQCEAAWKAECPEMFK